MVDGEGGTGTAKATGGYTGPLSDPEVLYISSTQQDGLFHYTGDIAELIIYGDTQTYPESPEFFAEKTQELIDAGISIIGGCCGTTPEHIRAVKKVVDSR
ncbi:MAG: hypothetical protein FVQ80_15920 [Planctomycetes bacterium]|nr:hypothetical protein [Planctomycetota bacterium]